MLIMKALLGPVFKGNTIIIMCILGEILIYSLTRPDVGIIVQLLFTSNQSKIEDELDIDFQATKEIVSKYNGNIVFDVKKFDDNINSISVLF